MCGLIGGFRTTKSNWNPNIKKFMYQGLVLSAFRGMQGTGVGLVQDDGELNLDKSRESAAEFLGSEQWENVEQSMLTATAILGHTRYPTWSNSVSSKNAQPFVYSNDKEEHRVMMIHNGHIQDHTWLTRKLKDKFEQQVDSAHLCKALACHEGSPETLLAKVKGNYALVWFDEDARRIYTANNGGRELYMAASKDSQAIYFASEDLTLQYLLERNAIEYSKILEVPKMQLYGFDLDGKDLEPSVHVKYKEEPTYATAVTSYNTNWNKDSKSKKGNVLWVKLEGNESFTPYPDLKDGSKAQFGHCNAITTVDVGAIVHINSIKQSQWEDISLVRSSTQWGGTFPVIVDSCEEEVGPGGKPYNYYEVQLHPQRFQEEVERVRGLKSVVASSIASTSTNAVWVPGPGHAKVPRSTWNKTAEEGCFHCKGSILPIDIGKVGFQLIKTDIAGDDLYQMVCPMCVDRIAHQSDTPKTGEQAQ